MEEIGEEIKNRKVLQSRETSKRILTQAIKVFLEKGYHGATIDDVCRAAGVTKGSIYWHFKSKEDLLRRIIGDIEKRFLDGMIQKVEEVKGGFSDKIEKYFRYSATFAYYNPELLVSFTTLSAELIGAHHPIEPEIRHIYKKHQKFLSSLIVQGKKEKILKKEINPDLAAKIIVAFHDGILFGWFMDRNEMDGEAYAIAFKKIVLKGLMV